MAAIAEGPRAYCLFTDVIWGPSEHPVKKALPNLLFFLPSGYGIAVPY